MSLRDYASKRRFNDTPEPSGKRPAGPGKRLAFVVQEHRASSLHYDFRLELGGVLKSWAVPKGPSLNPHEHRLAVMTEDHPYEYRTFEGVISEGNYGAGEVIIWDAGWYEARADDGRNSVKNLRVGLQQGHLTFVLHGQKLQGEFALIRMAGDEQKNWLLVKKADVFASAVDVTAKDRSVKSLRRVSELEGLDFTAYPKRAEPWRVHPMLCTLVEEPFAKDGWLFEIKWDGYRAIGVHHGQEIALYSRAQTDFAATYPPIAEALRTFRHDTIVDGEIVVVDQDGRPRFEWLQNWPQDHRGQLQYQLFDILWYDGHDVRAMPLAERKALLRRTMPPSEVLRYSDHFERDGRKLFAEMRRRGMEGVVAKLATSPYRENDRGAAWLKIKAQLRQEVVIGGYTEPRGSRQYLGSLLVGLYDHGQLVYVGHSGGGIPDEQRRRLRDQLARLERPTSPFATEPKPNAPVHWVRPELVCEMSFREWTQDGSMRHPQYLGLRPDKAPKAVHRELPQAIATVTPPVTLARSASKLPFEPTHLDKVFFPRHRYTKNDIFRYYETVAGSILPYVKGRPCSLLRMPAGITGESFFQKNHEHLPEWAPSVDIFSDSNHTNLHWMVGGDLGSLMYMVQLGCVEINPWNARVGHLDQPDWAVIDLDPEGVEFAAVVRVAHVVKEVCDGWKIPTHPKTSGKTGLHIYIPLGAKYTHDQAKNLVHLIVLEANRRLPELTSVERLPKKRLHRVYLDFLQNRSGQTLAAPYSLRPTPDATVSMPLHWDEVNARLKPTNYTIKNAARRLARTGDLWQPVLGPGIDLAAILAHIGSS